MNAFGVRSCCSALALIGCCSATLAGVPANDNCTNPTAITGTGFFNFDLVDATTGQEGQNAISCTATGEAAFVNDVWFCWTATCTGLVTVGTCGLTNVDTRIALYVGCDCPDPATEPFCCNDDACGGQSGFTCEVQCGQQYLIQIGHKPGTPPGTGEFRIECEGEPCPPTPPESNDCCGGKPAFLAPLSPNFSEVIAAATHDRPCLTDYVVHVIDLKNQASAPLNSNWNTPFFNPATSCPPAAPPHATWTKGHLGTVFGVAIDDVGNIYVAHASLYGQFDNPTPDTLGVGGAGAVYKIDTNTAIASVFATLPNLPDPSITPLSESYPGLGNLAFDCQRQMLYVSNNEDGRIYRIDTSGTVLSTFDHATGAIAAGGAPEPNDPPGFVPPIERVWAVQPHNGRLYYSTWDSGPNPIWSVALNGSGDFIAGSQQQETFSGGGFAFGHHPVSDITFNKSGCMLAAERSMAGPTTSASHQSRLLEFCFNAGSGQWDPGNVFTVGIISGKDTAGGVDYDGFNDRVFATADAIQFGPQYIYGLQGLPGTGGAPANSIMTDLDQDVVTIDKHQIGSVEVSCFGKCMDVSDEEILCEIGPKGPTGCYTYTFTLTNNSGQTAQYLLFPNSSISPNVIVLNPPLGPGASTTITTTICNVPAGGEYCFGMILADANIQECCALEHCVPIPDCECFQTTQVNVTCGSAANTLSLTFSLQNLTLDTIEHLFLFAPLPPDPNSNMTINPNYIDILTLPPFGTTGPHNVTLTFPSAPTPGSQICITVSIHSANLHECCSKEICFTVPDCQPVVNCPADVTGNGVVDVDDLLVIINNWGSSNPVSDIAPLPAGNGTTDVDDLLLVINSWGPCPQ